MNAKLGPFELTGILGGGGMGLVFEGRHVEEDVPVAVKVLTAARAREDWFLSAFEREVALLARLNHPHIATLHDAGVVDAVTAGASRHLTAGSPWLAMDLVRGRQMDHRERPWPEMKRLLVDLLDALAHAHALGVLHRDLKPENVLIRDDGRLVLVDFGVGIDLDDGSAQALAETKVIGTPAYMAPEQIRGRPRDHGPWTDMYGVGCIAWWLATGDRAFEDGETREVFRAVLRGETRGPFHSRVEVPAGFEGWIRRLMQRRHQGRYQRAADAAYELLRLDLDRSSDGAFRVDTHELTLFEGAHEALARGEVSAVLALEAVAKPGDERRLVPPIPAVSQFTLQTHLSTPLPEAGLGLFPMRVVPMVNRDNEREALWESLLRVRDEGAVRSVTLAGPAGTGKTRLAEWLARRGHELGAVTVLKAHCGRQLGASDGLGGMTRSFFRCQGLDWEPAFERIRSAYRDLGFESSEQEHYASGMADLATRALGSGEESRRFVTSASRNAAFNRLFQRLCEDRVVLFWVEDAHHADGAVELARYLKESKAEIEVLIVCTVRTTAPPSPWVERAHREIERERHVSLRVGPLERDHHRTLVRQLVRLETKLAESVVKRTEGNPLFAVQIVGDWIARGVLRSTPSGFCLKDAADPEMPASIAELWRGRIHRVAKRVPMVGPGDAEAVLEVAAVMGPSVDEAEWRAACEMEGLSWTEAFVDELAREGLLRREGARWTFAHGMLWEALLESVRDNDRLRHCHDAVVHVLRARYTAPTSTVRRRIAAHLTESTDVEAGLEPLLVAAMLLVGEADYWQAGRVLEQHSAAMEQLGLEPDDRRAVGNALLRARVAYGQGKREVAAELADRVLDVALEAGWDSEIGMAMRVVAETRRDAGELAESLALFDHAARHFMAAKLPEELAQNHVDHASVYLRMGALSAAREHLTTARTLFSAVANSSMLAKVHYQLGYLSTLEGDPDAARAALAEALVYAEEVGNRALLAGCWNNLGEVARAEGNWAEAADAYARARDLWELVGDEDADLARLNVVTCAIASGGFSEAEVGLIELEQRIDGISALGAEPFVRAQRACVAAASGDWMELVGAIEALEVLLVGSSVSEQDLGFLIQKAFDLTHGARDDLALRLGKLALSQWVRLRNRVKTKELKASLAEIDLAESLD